MEFEYSRLFIIIIATILAFLLVSYKMQAKKKTLLFFCYIFLGIYSGVGGALVETASGYTFFYVAYLCILSISIRCSSLAVDYKKDQNTLNVFVEQHASKLLLLYFGLTIISFVYPEVKLKNLLSPPPPVLSGFDFEEEGNNYVGGLLSSVIYLLKAFILPFFYIGLYKYRSKPSKVLLLLLLDLYLVYCKSGYVGRGTILKTAIICFFVVYYQLSKRAKKRLIFVAAALSPIVLYGFYRYSLIRMGTDVSGETISQAVEILFGQEICYPMHYNYYIGLKNHHIGDYLSWLVLLPLPGFLKFGLGDYFLNREFSMEILGLDASDSYFFILLPGVVGEGLYVFGPYLFWLHAIVLGIFIRFVIDTFTSNEVFTYYFYNCIVSLSFMLARAGTVSVYPIMMKSILSIIIVFYFVCRRRKSKIT